MLDFKVTPENGQPFEVTATTRDIYRWEKTTRGASFGKLREDQHMVDLYKIAYFAATRQGMWSGTLAEFEDTCDLDILNKSEEEEPDPTPPTL